MFTINSGKKSLFIDTDCSTPFLTFIIINEKENRYKVFNKK